MIDFLVIHSRVMFFFGDLGHFENAMDDCWFLKVIHCLEKKKYFQK